MVVGGRLPPISDSFHRLRLDPAGGHDWALSAICMVACYCFFLICVQKTIANSCDN